MDDQEQQPVGPGAPIPAMPWWQSKLITGIAIAIITDLVHFFHLSKLIPPDQISTVADLALQVAGLAGLAWALRGRLQQKFAAPVTLTKAKAIAINTGTAPNPTSPPTPTAEKPT